MVPLTSTRRGRRAPVANRTSTRPLAAACAIAAAAVLLSSDPVAPLAARPQAPAPAPTQDRPTFQSRQDLVVVSAIVVDRDRQPIQGLSKEDFEVREDGKPVPVTTFLPMNAASQGPQEGGRYLVLLLDDVMAAQSRAWRIKDIARMFADRMGPRDVGAVVRLNGGASKTAQGPAAMRSAIEQFQTAPKPLAPAEFTVEHALETVASLSRALAQVPHRRKTLVFIGASPLFGATRGGLPGTPRTVSPEWRAAVREASRHNVAFYVIDPAGLTGTAQQYDDTLGFAGETGGLAFVNTNFFERSVEHVWQEAGYYYLLGYAAPVTDGKLHEIEVRVKREDTQVRARRTRG